MMKRARPVFARLLLGAAAASLMWPMSARASVLSGCVSPEEAGVNNHVGWIDVGVMLGMADPEPPASLQVTDPTGGVTEYLDGVGLIPPTDVLPIWFASAEQVGTYELVVNRGEPCTVEVGNSPEALLISLESIPEDWVPRSAPVIIGANR